MSTNLQAMQAAAADVERYVIGKVVDLHVNFHRRVVGDIPVVTGEHRGNNRVGLNGAFPSPAPTGLPAYPIMGDHEIDSAFAAGKLGDSFDYISQGPVPALLDAGRSKQAPSGYFEKNIRPAIDDTVRGAK